MLKLSKKGLFRKRVNLLLKFMSLNLSGVHLHKGNFFGTETEIGVGTRINGKFLCKGAGKISIGKYCAIGHNVKAITANHNLNTINLQVQLNHELGVDSADANKQDIYIGNNVWIGDNAFILPGVSIGDGAIIGACAVVTKNVDPFSIIAGNPAKLIRFRFQSDEVRNMVKEIKWWDWSKERIKMNREFFAKDFNSMSSEELKNVIENLK